LEEAAGRDSDHKKWFLRPLPAELTTKPFSEYDEAILKQATL
jgi:hypothetical protein